MQALKNVTAKKSQGFTLIELIVVVIILGILSTAISSFINFGIQTYTNATLRDELTSSARFAIERLNREIRNAVPNSIRTTSDGTALSPRSCIEFTPIVLSAIYTDIPVAPEPATASIKLVAFDETQLIDSLNVGVYLLSDAEFYSGSSNKIQPLLNNTIDKTAAPEWLLSLNSAHTFAEDSPTNRLYFFNDVVSYCIKDKELRRIQGYTANASNTPPVDSGVLMAENINMFIDREADPLVVDAPFQVDNATQLRSSLVSIKLTFESESNFEKIVFNTEIQVANVP